MRGIKREERGGRVGKRKGRFKSVPEGSRFLQPCESGFDERRGALELRNARGRRDFVEVDVGQERKVAVERFERRGIVAQKGALRAGGGFFRALSGARCGAAAGAVQRRGGERPRVERLRGRRAVQNHAEKRHALRAQAIHGKPRLVEGAQAVPDDENRRERAFAHEVEHGFPFVEGDEESACAFENEKAPSGLGRSEARTNSREHVGGREPPAFELRGERGRSGGGKREERFCGEARFTGPVGVARAGCGSPRLNGLHVERRARGVFAALQGAARKRAE